MKKFIEISEEAYARLSSGRCVEGSLHMNEWTGSLSFNAYNRQQPKHRKRDKVICQLEHGWLKESKQRYKFYNSVKKELGIPMTQVVMERELKTAVHELEIERIIDIL